MGQKTYKVLFYITLFFLLIAIGWAVQTTRTFSSYAAVSKKALKTCTDNLQTSEKNVNQLLRLCVLENSRK